MTLAVLPVHGLPEVVQGDDLAALIAAAVELRDGDVVVVAQKVVSKAEGAVVRVPEGEDRAAARAALVRREAVAVLVATPFVTVVQTRHGLVCANAGIDASNAAPGTLVLLPADPDASARRIRQGLRALGADVAVIVTDTFGRAWRTGQTDVAIGVSGLPAVRDERGGVDRAGMVLEVTEVALADEVAAAADLVRRKADGVPVVVVRGLAYTPDEGARATDLQRAPAADLFPRGRGALADALAVSRPPVPPDGGVQPAAGDLAAAAAAATTAGGGRVAVALDGVSVVLVARDAGAPEDLVALGIAAGSARAALLDAGLDGALDLSAAPAGRVVVVPVRPEPHVQGRR